MPRDLFGEVVRPAVRIGGRTWCGLPLTILVHAVLIATIVIAPLVATDVLPPLPRALAYYVQLGTPEPPAGPPRVPQATARRAPDVNPLAAPVDAPSGIAPDSGLVREPEAGMQSGVQGSVFESVEGSGLMVVPEAPPPPPPPEGPRRITSTLRPPAKIKDVMPVYPELAQKAHVAGTVILDATIGTDGKVVNVRILRSVPLLDEAAIAAVRQWEFTPTRLNGVAVPVVMTVTVHFALR